MKSSAKLIDGIIYGRFMGDVQVANELGCGIVLVLVTHDKYHQFDIAMQVLHGAIAEGVK